MSTNGCNATHGRYDPTRCASNECICFGYDNNPICYDPSTHSCCIGSSCGADTCSSEEQCCQGCCVAAEKKCCGNGKYLKTCEKSQKCCSMDGNKMPDCCDS